MKLWKKLLIGVAVLAVIVVGLVGYGLFKAGKVYTEKIEPDMKRYVLMTQQEQDEYVLSRLTDLYEMVYRKDAQNEQHRAAAEAIKNNPSVRQAGLVWGRSICASIIINSAELSRNLSPADRAKYLREADDLDDKGEHFTKEMTRALPVLP
ncbi:MAG: hypothetical protein IJ812_00325 [Schwartzia sp.]|nr:hypothetical protein [Schwartzia sp. (in: firmicutes)]MBR1759977.1 hypothetical protein [Schwartzia sp. (in: firmicutes)]MBR1884828.1 hypothetical protein [Schwartzia sp. (in: firmicutes)]